jgi:hypothetical protein
MTSSTPPSATRRPPPPSEGRPPVPTATRTRSAWLLSTLAAVGALTASTAGLLLDEAYDANPATTEMLRGYDLVTAVVVAPLLVGSLLRRRGPTALRTGLLAYLAYTFLLASVTGGLGRAFLLDVAVLSISMAALATSLVSIDVRALRVPGPTPDRVAGALLGVLAVALAGMWVVAAVTSAATGEMPAGSVLVESDLVVRLGIVLDLALLVPSYALAAVLLWQGSPWGFVLGVLATVSGLLHQLSYQAGMVVQSLADVPGARWFDPFEPAIVLVYVVALVALLTGRSRQ